jgi:hypothetical protein
MRPNQCGTGRPLDTLHPGDAAAIREFAEWLTDRKAANQHQVAVATIMAGATQLELVAGAPYHVDDFVKVTEGRHGGRWGVVTEVIDYRGLHKVGADNSEYLSFLVMVSLKTTMPGVGMVEHPPAPVPFEPYELEQLFGAKGGAGDWVKGGRVVSRRNWPSTRDGLGA